MAATKVRCSKWMTQQSTSLEKGQVGSFKLKVEAQLCPADNGARVKADN